MKDLPQKPQIYKFHDYREYLREHLVFVAATKGLSLRKVAKEIDLAPSHLSMALKGERGFSDKSWARILDYFELNALEKKYVTYLRTIADSDAPEDRVEAYKKLQRSKLFTDHNPKEIRVYQFLTKWFYVAIREMANLPGFKLDPKWIQKKLKTRVPIQELRDAIQFLVENEYLKLDSKGKVIPPKETDEPQVDCLGSVFRLSLSKFYREMLKLSGEAIENTPRSERQLMGHTFAMDQGSFKEVEAILAEALEKVKAVEAKQKNAEVVYHVSFGAFPLSQKVKG